MMRRLNLILVLVSGFAISCTSGIPDRIGDWRVEVGPAGNDFYQAPPEREVAPPSERLFEIVQLIAPEETEVKRWELQGKDRYFIRAEAGSQEYDFRITSEGKLLELEYEDDLANVLEQPGHLVLSNTLQEIPLKKVPKTTLATLKKIEPETTPGQAWSVSTTAGPRFVVALGDTAFFARPDGQIQAIGSIEKGALEEVDLSSVKSAEEVADEAKSLLGPYKARFDVDQQIEKLENSQPNGPFRFVVLGDTRSNPDLWTEVIRHIDQLDPPPAFIIDTGDIVRHGYTAEYLEYFLPALEGSQIPFFVAIGNHDDGDNSQALEYQSLFGPDSLNYYFDYGSFRFIVIDNVTTLRPYSETLAWLGGVLKKTPSNLHTIVAAHRPIATVQKWAYHSWEEEDSAVFADLMSSNEVKHVFFGHIHAYSTAHLNGVEYTISGGGGAGLHNRYGPKGNVHHYIICDVDTDGSLTQQVVRFYHINE